MQLAKATIKVPPKGWHSNKPEWLKNTPPSWDSVPFGSIFTQKKKKNSKLQRDFVLSVMKDKGVIPYTEKGNVGNKVSEDLSGYKLVNKGDFVLNSMNLYMGSVGVSDYDGITSTAYIVCKPSDDIHARYYYYLIQFKGFQDHAGLLGKGILEIREAVRWTALKSVSIPKPDKNTQRKIADFLDRETARIDLLIEKKEKSFELVKQKRDATILDAVTLGVADDQDTQDTNISWAPKIPSNWIMKKLKFVGSATIGLTYSPDQLTNENLGIPVLRANNIQNGKITRENMVFVDTKVPNNLILNVGDILICSRNGSRSLIGKNGLITSEFEGMTFGVFNTVFRSKIGDYLYWAMQSPMFKHQSSSFLTSTINQLTTTTLMNLSVPIPPRDEQKKIISYLTEKERYFVSKTEKIEQSIKLLREYKAALITAAVTGQIDVESANKSGTNERHLDKLQEESEA